MDSKRYLRCLKSKIIFYYYLLGLPNKEKFKCPVCDYSGSFLDIDSQTTGLRKHAKCPKCGALERHRLQYLVVSDLLSSIDPMSRRMLHFAPEPFFRDFFSSRFGHYETADLNMDDVDHNVDLQQLPFEDDTYDFVFASHVLEHVPDDQRAISEIRRILKPKGIAILPVPLVAEETVEYPEPNPNEYFHARAPGPDYFGKYRPFFARVDQFKSDAFPGIYQLHIYEDRSNWPTKEIPLRPPMKGGKHLDIVPVLYASASD